MPPGPVSVTNRTSGDSSSDDSSTMSSSRPSNEVDGVGNERRGSGISVATGAAAGEADATGVANRSLSNSAKSSRTSRLSSRVLRKVR